MSKNNNHQNNLFVKVKTAKKKTNSSTKWLQRQLNDHYVRQSKVDGYRSRSAYKLLQIDDKFNILKNAQIVVDLGCAPGGWLQVAKQRMKSNNNNFIIGIDLLDLDPIEGVNIIKGDFLAEESVNQLQQILNNKKADLVMSDMASNSTGHKNTDHIRISYLCEKVFEFCDRNIAKNGNLIVKVLQGGTENNLLKSIKSKFQNVKHFKPDASRKDSRESYLVATGYKN